LNATPSSRFEELNFRIAKVFFVTIHKSTIPSRLPEHAIDQKQFLRENGITGD
jgi:hypothetical protein